MSDSNDIYSTQAVGVSNGTQPNAGQVFSFSATLVGVPVAFDLKPLVNLNRLNNVQGVFLDNSEGTSTLICSTSIGQAIKVPAGSQAVMPIYLSADKVITLNGNGTVPVCLLNFPTPAEVWEAGTGGLVLVSDPALEALINDGGLNVNVISGGSTVSQGYGPSDETVVARVRNGFNSGKLVSGTQTVFSGECYIDSFVLDLSADATVTSGGLIGWQLKSPTTTAPNIVQTFHGGDATGSGWSVNLSNNPVVGNTLFLFASWQGGQTFTQGTGFTQLGSTEQAADGNNLAVYTKTVTSTSTTIGGFSSSANTSIGIIEVNSVTGETFAYGGLATSNSGNVTTVALPAPSTGTVDQFVVAWSASNFPSGSPTVSSGATVEILQVAVGGAAGFAVIWCPSTQASPLSIDWGQTIGSTPGAIVVDVQGASGANTVIAQGDVYVPGTATTTAGRVNLCNLEGMKLTVPNSADLDITINSGTLATGGLYWTALGGATSVN